MNKQTRDIQQLQQQQMRLSMRNFVQALLRMEKVQGSRLTVANQPQPSKNSILASGFCTSLAILASGLTNLRESTVTNSCVWLVKNLFWLMDQTCHQPLGQQAEKLVSSHEKGMHRLFGLIYIFVFPPSAHKALQNLCWMKLATNFKDFPALTAIFKDFQGPCEPWLYYSLKNSNNQKIKRKIRMDK